MTGSSSRELMASAGEDSELEKVEKRLQNMKSALVERCQSSKM